MPSPRWWWVVWLLYTISAVSLAIAFVSGPSVWTYANAGFLAVAVPGSIKLKRRTDRLRAEHVDRMAAVDRAGQTAELAALLKPGDWDYLAHPLDQVDGLAPQLGWQPAVDREQRARDIREGMTAERRDRLERERLGLPPAPPWPTEVRSPAVPDVIRLVQGLTSPGNTSSGKAGRRSVVIREIAKARDGTQVGWGRRHDGWAWVCTCTRAGGHAYPTSIAAESAAVTHLQREHR